MPQDDELEAQSPPSLDPAEDMALMKRLQSHLSAEVSKESAHYLLLICCFVTGLTDATLFNGIWQNFYDKGSGCN